MESAEAAEFNASMVQDLANGLVDDVEQQDYESAGGALYALIDSATRLLRNLEEIDDEAAREAS